MTSLWVGVVLGFIGGLRVGMWYGLKRLSAYDLRQRWANINKKK